MSALKPKYTVSSYPDRGEVHFSASGFWDMETMTQFQRELIAAARPLFENGKPMRSFADLRGFVAQSSEVSDAIRTAVTAAAQLGTERTAMVSDSALTRSQYRRLHEDLQIQTFEDPSEALQWLRED
ncbi:MAG: hypothetical protein SXU28_12990 [Pseudomonadota bacterium]|nr:hypothetical protein [Pseudomonadota bacterium]